jgi:hypothetical protein
MDFSTYCNVARCHNDVKLQNLVDKENTEEIGYAC